MALMLARRSLARSLLSRMAPAMSGGMQQGGSLDLQNSQTRYKSSHAENTNKFIVEVRWGLGGWGLGGWDLGDFILPHT